MARTLEQVRQEGLDALRDRLGVADMLRFLQQFSNGSGDYATERHKCVDETSIDDILQAAKAAAQTRLTMDGGGDPERRSRRSPRRYAMSTRTLTLLCTTAVMSIVSGCGVSLNKPADPNAPNLAAPAPVLTDAELAAQEQEWQEFLKTRRDVIGRLNAAAAQPGFKEAVALVQQETGAAPMPYVSYEEAEETVAGAMLFDVPYDEQNELVKRLFEPVNAKGCYVFRVQNNFGLDGARDQIGVVATTDCYDVISLQAVSTNGEMSTAGVIRWLKDLEQREPFRITGCGIDFIEGDFLTPIDEAEKLAKEIYEFCPDIVDQGVGDVEALAQELRTKQSLYFWWD